MLPKSREKKAQNNYGFRPKRSAHDALRKCGEYLKAGEVWTVDMDLEKFFDTVNQSRLMEESAEIRDTKFQCGNTGKFKEGLPANRRKPDYEHSPPEREAREGRIPVFQFLLLRV